MTYQREIPEALIAQVDSLLKRHAYEQASLAFTEGQRVRLLQGAEVIEICKDGDIQVRFPVARTSITFYVSPYDIEVIHLPADRTKHPSNCYCEGCYCSQCGSRECICTAKIRSA